MGAENGAAPWGYWGEAGMCRVVLVLGGVNLGYNGHPKLGVVGTIFFSPAILCLIPPETMARI